jgi:hypothetical protein
MRGWIYHGLVCCLLCACRDDAGLSLDGMMIAPSEMSEHGGAPPGASSADSSGEWTGPAVSSNAGQAPVSESGFEANCAAERVTLEELHSGRVRGRLPVSLGALVASSQKFLVSEAKSGSCLWGAFAADPLRTGAATGLFLVSFGTPHADGEPCEGGNDGLPDDLAPGDAIEARGIVDEFVPAACEGVAAAQQLRIDASCPLRRMGRTAPPAPALVDVAFADRLARGDDASLLRQWSGTLVRLESVSAMQDPDDGDAVFPFGIVRLNETRLEVRSRLYYFDLTEGGPRDSGKSPHYRYPSTFESITGLVLLDYCTWVLAPRHPCVDAPASSGCAPQAGGP